MGLHDIKPGLGDPSRRFIQNGKSTVKVQLSIDPGDELIVSEGVAAQLEAADPGFQAPTSDKRETWAAIREDAAAQVKAEQAALTSYPDAPAEAAPEPVKPEPVAPAKKAAPKKAAAKRTDA